MTFNPSNYEHVYGFELLDTIHNLFPEIMYDDELFSNEMETYLRYRMSRHFPAMFSRQQSLYRLYNSARIREEVANWRLGNIIVPNEIRHIHHPSPVRFVRQRSPYGRSTTHPTNWARDTTQTSATTATTQSAAPTTHTNEPRIVRQNRTVRTAGTHAEPNILVSMITSELMDILPNIRTRWGEQEQFVDINVAPTPQQIDAFSEIKENSAIPQETVCAVCQDHETQSPNNVWRILRCQHSFHKVCVDTWFQRNVHCPVCRIDIRDLYQGRPPTNIQ
jgi:hypothetical protein